jgi:hypothetical protein
MWRFMTALIPSNFLLAALWILRDAHHHARPMLAAAVCEAYLAYGAGQQGWAWGLGGLAVLFNPIVPIAFERGV